MNEWIAARRPSVLQEGTHERSVQILEIQPGGGLAGPLAHIEWPLRLDLCYQS